jgi:hypothetical protein
MWCIFLFVLVLESHDISAMYGIGCFENIVAIFGPHTSHFEIVETGKLFEGAATPFSGSSSGSELYPVGVHFAVLGNRRSALLRVRILDFSRNRAFSRIEWQKSMRCPRISTRRPDSSSGDGSTEKAQNIQWEATGRWTVLQPRK